MIDELMVSNLGIIGEAHLEPPSGFTVISGETGTGKTLLLGALRLLRGDTAPSQSVGPAGGEASVHGRFVVDGHEVAASRRVVAGARSKAYLDGAPVTAAALRGATEPWVEIVGQHDQMVLTTADGARALLDHVLPNSVLDRYESAWGDVDRLKREEAALGGDRRAIERELATARHEADEIESAALTPEVEDELRIVAQRMRNAEGLAEGLSLITQIIDGDGGVGDSLQRVAVEMNRLTVLDPELADVAAVAEEAATLVSEVTRQAGRHVDELEHDPRLLAGMEDRLATIAQLKRKYGASLSDVIAYGSAAAARAAEIERLLARSGEVEAALDEARTELDEAAASLRTARLRAARRLAKNAAAHLLELGFADPVVEFDLSPTEPGPRGADRVTLLFSSDAAITPGAASKIASGGELSRLVLALRLASGAADVPIVVFDEIDAGVGGATALALGRKIADLAHGRQVLCVTHLPQVAAFADAHYVVERVGSAATVSLVEGERRLEELSRMLSGLPDSDQGRGHAAELLEMAGAS